MNVYGMRQRRGKTAESLHVVVDHVASSVCDSVSLIVGGRGELTPYTCPNDTSVVLLISKL